jgi:hypothetical protein
VDEKKVTDEVDQEGDDFDGEGGNLFFIITTTCMCEMAGL